MRPSRLLARVLVLALLGVPIAHGGEALFDSNAEATRAINSVLVASPYKISGRARAGTIRYTFEHPGLEWDWPETAEQHVARDGARTVVTICPDCGKEATPSAEELARYRQPNPWVDSNDRDIRAFARRAGGRSVESRMSALVPAVQKHMNGAIDYRQYASATEAFASREGDCTEFAVLLAAAARARDIPARVVAGLAYDSRFLGQPHAFGPHMWVQVWTGERWRSYDAALGRFDAGHVALRIGDGSPLETRGVMQLISELRLVDAAGLLPAARAGSAEISAPAPAR